MSVLLRNDIILGSDRAGSGYSSVGSDRVGSQRTRVGSGRAKGAKTRVGSGHKNLTRVGHWS